jgi:hypothetical protein
MAFFDLCVAVLLFFNSVAILNEDRFLAKRASRGCAASPHGCMQAPAARATRVASALMRVGLHRWLALQ